VDGINSDTEIEHDGSSIITEPGINLLKLIIHPILDENVEYPLQES
jgi:hypothetical protein